MTPAVAPDVQPIIADAADKSFNGLVSGFTTVLPYAIAIGVLAWGVKFVASRTGTRGHL